MPVKKSSPTQGPAKRSTSPSNRKVALLPRKSPNKVIIGVFVGLAIAVGTTVIFLTHASTLPTSRYSALKPTRILDSRPGSGLPNAGFPLSGNQTYSHYMWGKYGVASGATAVVLNITEASATTDSYLTVFPHGESRPNASTINVRPGTVGNNQATVKLGSDGSFSIYNYSGTVNYIVDIVGYYGASGQALFPIRGMRIADTRPGAGQPYAGATLYPYNGLGIKGSGLLGEPTGTTSLVVNITVINPLSSGYLSTYSSDEPRPNTSSLNFYAGTSTTKEVTVALGYNGNFANPGYFNILNNSGGKVDVIVDVVGYYAPYSPGQAKVFVPATPARVADTRGGNRLGTNGVLNVKTTTVNGETPGAAVINLTAINGTANSFLTVYPNGMGLPNAMNLSYSPGQVAFNEVTTKLGADGSFNIYNFTGATDIIVDVVGYYVNETTDLYGCQITGYGPSPQHYHSSLSSGATGGCVKELQSRLNSWCQTQIAVDGTFGSTTTDDVKRYQAGFGLPVDGIVGDTTWSYLHRPHGDGVPPC